VEASSAEQPKLPPLEENWVTLTDLCRSQKVGYRTGLAWIKSKKLRAVMVGGRWRIYESELRRFLLVGYDKAKGG